MQAGILGLLVVALAQPAIIFAPPPRPHAIGDGVIKGRVLDQRGKPLAGVLVEIGTYNPAARDSFRRTGYPTLADKRGHFEIVGVPPGDWTSTQSGPAESNAPTFPGISRHIFQAFPR